MRLMHGLCIIVNANDTDIIESYRVVKCRDVQYFLERY